MKNLMINNQNIKTGVITLKEITDLLNVEHNKAMKVVEKLAEEPNFGTVEKIATVYNSKGQTIQTYILNKKQAIAVGAKLNNSLLMKVIDRVEQLERDKNSSNSFELNQKFDETLKALSQKSIEADSWKERYLQGLERENQLLYEKIENKKSITIDNENIPQPKKGTGIKVTKDEIEKMRELKHKGYSNIQIAKLVNRSINSVVRYV